MLGLRRSQFVNKAYVTEQEAVDRDINRLSNMLDKDSYATARAAGQNMTMEQAIEMV